MFEPIFTGLVEEEIGLSTTASSEGAVFSISTVVEAVSVSDWASTWLIEDMLKADSLKLNTKEDPKTSVLIKQMIKNHESGFFACLIFFAMGMVVKLLY